MVASVAPSTAIKLVKATFLRESREPMEGDLASVLAEFENSEYSTEDYSWVGEAPRMELLEDELRIEKLSDAEYSIDNETYAIGINIRRRDLRLDKIGGLIGRARQLARVARKHPNRLLIQAIEAGTTDTGFDGAAIYSNAHPDRGSGGAQDNLLAGTGTTVAAFEVDLNAAIQALAEVDAENGEPMHEGIGELALLSPWGLRSTVQTVLRAETIDNTSNVAFRDFNIRPIYSARLTDPNDWFLFHLSGGHRPLILQQLDGLTTEELGEGSDQWVHKEVMTFKARWDGAVGWGHWGNTNKTVNA